MKFLKNCALVVLALGVSAAVASAGIRCDEHAKKASTTKASSHCATKAAKVSNASAVKKECTVAEKEACTAAEKQACATNAKSASVTKVKSSSCCATKAKNVKTASTEAVPAEAPVVQASVNTITPQK